MRTKDLEVRRCEESGELGWVFSDMRDIDGMIMVSTAGYMLAHDLFEHVNGIDRIGSVGDEIEALGAMYFVRGWNGNVFDGSEEPHHRRRYISPEQDIASDIEQQFQELICRDDGDWAHVIPGKTMPLRDGDEWVTDSLECTDIMRVDLAQDGAAEDWLEYHEFFKVGRIKYKHLRPAWDHYMDQVRSLLRCGYRKAYKQYKGDHMAAHNMFWNVAREMDRWTKHPEYEGQQGKLYWDRNRAVFEEVYPDEYYED